jgi:multiple sugar transport system permease protein
VAMALIMHKAFKGRGIVRASILVPWAIPTVVSALLWKWIFQADGIANDILGTQILWSTEGWQSKLSVIIADTWKTAPFIGLLVLAGLQTISAEVYEAAKVDGANAWQTFRRITLPLVKPALLVAVLFRILDTLRIFDLPFVLVGPHKDSVETLSMLAYDEAFNTRYGPAAAYATVLFIYVAVVAYAFVKILGADVIGEARAKKPGGGAKAGRKKREIQEAPGVAIGATAAGGGD